MGLKRGWLMLPAMTAVLLTSACGNRFTAPSGPGEAAERGGPRGDGLPVAMIRIGDTAAAIRDYETAARFYRRAHQAAPDRVEPLLRLGGALNALEGHDEAAEFYRKALALDAGNTAAIRGLARAEVALAGTP
ncbi:MAG: hypothetical protein FJX67_17080, partial [Alphaproteobacteria bacterium]|nr:hypothetical protein [Alphaproteobacteria bacterium]